MDYKIYIFEKLKNAMSNFENKRKKELLQWKSYNDKEKKKIIIFGAGAMGEKCCNYLESMGIQIDLICDNDTSRRGAFVTANQNCINVVPVEILLQTEKDVLWFVATGAQHFDSVREQLFANCV